MSGHTPGPWTVRAGSFPYDALESFAVCYEIVMPLGPVISKANGQLIEAAPDLYDAAVWVLHNAHGISKSGEDGVSQEEENASWAALMAATKKAEGR